MERFRQFAMTGLGVLMLSTAIAVSGLGQVASAAVQDAKQTFFISGGSVKVSGTVNVASSPALKIDPSGNTVQTVVGAPTNPVQFGGRQDFTTAADAGDATKTVYTVPAGKRLVIEYVSGHFMQPDSSLFAHAAFSIDSGPLFYVPLQNESGVGRGSGYDFDFVGSAAVRVYANAGQTVVLHVPHTAIFQAEVDLAFSGYLVDAS